MGLIIIFLFFIYHILRLWIFLFYIWLQLEGNFTLHVSGPLSEAHKLGLNLFDCVLFLLKRYKIKFKCLYMWYILLCDYYMYMLPIIVYIF